MPAARTISAAATTTQMSFFDFKLRPSISQNLGPACVGYEQANGIEPCQTLIGRWATANNERENSLPTLLGDHSSPEIARSFKPFHFVGAVARRQDRIDLQMHVLVLRAHLWGVTPIKVGYHRLSGAAA